MGIRQELKTASESLRNYGGSGLFAYLGCALRRVDEKRHERRWYARHGTLSNADRNEILRACTELRSHPKISVILPVYDVEEKWLRRCIGSVLDQIYSNWELCIADDRSPSPHIRRVLDDIAAKDERVKVVFRPENGHISAASNSALELATGEFCVLLDHDDELSPDALFWVANELNEHPETAMIYSDEDMIDAKGRRYSPKFKPDLSLDLLYSLNLLTHLSAYKTELLRRIGGFRIGLEGSQDYDLALRCIERIDLSQIRHIPRVLYHWRAIPGSVALSGDEKPYAHDRARSAISEHFQRSGILADIEQTHLNLHRVRYRLPDNLPLVSLILYNANGDDAAVWNTATQYGSMEIKTVDPSDGLMKALNSAAASSNGEVLVFADAALMPPDQGQIAELVSLAMQSKIGVVGGRMIASNGTIADGAVFIGGVDLMTIAHRGSLCSEAGNMQRNILISNYSALSLSCLTVRRTVFEAAEGFDAIVGDRLAVVDLCLRIGESGLRIVHDPFAEFKIGKARSLANLVLPTSVNIEAFESRWHNVIKRDPFHNPNLEISKGGVLINA